MKKIILILFLTICTTLFSQVKPGRYLIKLSANGKALFHNGNSVTIQEPCADYKVNCNNQIWDIKIAQGRADMYLIQMAYNKKCVTFREIPNRNKIYPDLFMEAQKPLASIRNQCFFIKATANGQFTIQPVLQGQEDIKDSTDDLFLAAKSSNMNSNMGDVMFDYKNQVDNPMGYNDTSNVYFNFFPVQNATSTVVVTPRNNPVVNSPSVIVAPKSDNKIDIDLKTGGDNLEVKSFQDNLEVRILLANRADVVLKNANKNQSWPNNSIRRLSIGLPADITAADVKEIHLYRMSKEGIKYVWDLGEKDNWDLQNISATATIVTSGVKSRIEFEKVVSTRRGKPLFRFVYDGDGEFEGTSFKKAFTIKTANSPISGTDSEPVANAVINITIGTGGDDLRGGNDNAKMVISFKRNPIKKTLNNIFKSANLPNFSERSKIIEIPNSANFDVADIKEVELHHSGCGGIGADNWHIDKVKIIITKDEQTKTLVDRVGAPLHMFTGNARIKKFVVE